MGTSCTRLGVDMAVCKHFNLLVGMWREKLWPELDHLLDKEDEVNIVSTPYKAIIHQYQVVVHDPASISSKDKVNFAVQKELHNPTSFNRSCIHLEFNISGTERNLEKSCVMENNETYVDERYIWSGTEQYYFYEPNIETPAPRYHVGAMPGTNLNVGMDMWNRSAGN
ncbi:hypothetical protein Tco_1236646 [Tanacetum coccineum]